MSQYCHDAAPALDAHERDDGDGIVVYNPEAPDSEWIESDARLPAEEVA